MRAKAPSPLFIGAAVLGTLTAVAVLAPVLAPYDPRALAGEALEPPSSRHWLGTDNPGHDVLSQLIWGTRSSLTVAVPTAVLTLLLATMIGAGAALRGGLADRFAMRAVDTLLAVPVLPLLFLVAATVGASLPAMVVVLSILLSPVEARLLRSQTLSLRQRGFVVAARGLGGGLLYVLRRHFMPALGPLVVVSFATLAGMATALDAGLAFLGLADPSRVSWGMMLDRALGQQGLYFSPMWVWLVLPAGFAVTLTVLGFAFLGIGFEPRMNPRWRHGR